MLGATLGVDVGREVRLSGFKRAGRHREKCLTAAAVRNLGPGFHADGGNLYLKVDPSGARRWIVRLTVQGKRKDIGLGSASLVSLLEAREAALQHRKVARLGDDPLTAKTQSKSFPSFEDAARQVYNHNEGNWRSEKHTKQWLSSLERYAFPVIGKQRIDKVASADILRVLNPIWLEKAETARRVKQRIGTVLKWAIARDYRTDNPAETVQQALAKPNSSIKKHMLSLPYREVAGAIAKITASKALPATKLSLEFLIHTAARSGEVRGARWSEFDLERRTWVVPAERMKAKREHRIPLSAASLRVLRDAEAVRREGTDLVFPSATGKPLSDMTLSKLVKELGIKAVPHGFRSSFRVWAGEQTNHAHHVIEFALAHVVSNKAEAAYARSDLLERRRPLMEEWSGFLTEKAGHSKV